MLLKRKKIKTLNSNFPNQSWTNIQTNLDYYIFYKTLAEGPGVTRGTRKIRKNKYGIYDSNAAGHKAYIKRKYSKYQGMKVESNEDLKAYIIKNLKVLKDFSIAAKKSTLIINLVLYQRNF